MGWTYNFIYSIFFSYPDWNILRLPKLKKKGGGGVYTKMWSIRSRSNRVSLDFRDWQAERKPQKKSL